jgi:predicted ester cyclase
MKNQSTGNRYQYLNFKRICILISLLAMIGAVTPSWAAKKPIISCEGNEKNLQTYLQIHKVLFSDRDGSRVNEFYAEEIISHNSDGGGSVSRTVPSSFLANMWNTSLRTTPERVLDDELILCSGDYVIVRTMVRSRDNVGLPPYPATGKPFEISAIDIYRFKDGRVVERWGNSDVISQYRQLGYTFVPADQVSQERVEEAK